MRSYVELEQALRTKGMGSYFQNDDQLVVSDVSPAMPHSNCFSITNKAGDRYLGTSLPAVYRFPAKADLSVICEAVPEIFIQGHLPSG